MGKPRLGKRERIAKRQRLEAQKRLEYIRANSVPSRSSLTDNFSGDTRKEINRALRLLSGFNPKQSLGRDNLKGLTHYKGCSAGGAQGMGKPKKSKPMPHRFLPGHMARGHEDLATDNRPIGPGVQAKVRQARRELLQVIINSL